jgi:hypothetical protein
MKQACLMYIPSRRAHPYDVRVSLLACSWLVCATAFVCVTTFVVCLRAMRHVSLCACLSLRESAIECLPLSPSLHCMSLSLLCVSHSPPASWRSCSATLQVRGCGPGLCPTGRKKETSVVADNISDGRKKAREELGPAGGRQRYR